MGELLSSISNAFMQIKGYDSSMRRFLDTLNRLSKTSIYLFAYLIVFLIGLLDYATGAEISLSFFYLLPISIMVWQNGKKPGIVLSLFSTVVWFVSNKLAGLEHSYILIFYWNAVIRAGFFITTTYLLAEIRSLLEQARDLAHIDSLTGALNRRAFYEFTEDQIKSLKRVFRPFTVIYFDIDDFKNINDQLGHNVGDHLLQKVTETLSAIIRTHDRLVRLGGDEFIIYLPETGTNESHTIGSRLFENLNNVMELNRWPVSFSLGVMTFLKIPRSVDDVIHVSDELMYKSKKSGKNKIQYDVYEH